MSVGALDHSVLSNLLAAAAHHMHSCNRLGSPPASSCHIHKKMKTPQRMEHSMVRKACLQHKRGREERRVEHQPGGEGRLLRPVPPMLHAAKPDAPPPLTRPRSS